jgi:transcriptional regulator with XRE-family HTH domain
MKERLLQLLDLEQISPSKFADIIGVQRSSVSHVISGRNNPSYDFLQKTLKAFPGLNASWLMLGEGTMYEHMGRKVPGNLFDPPEASPEAQIPAKIPDQAPEPEEIPSSEHRSEESKAESPAFESHKAAEKTPESPVLDELQKHASENRRKIVQVMVIYEDDTFRTFAPAQ